MVRYATIHYLMVMAVIFNLDVDWMDVITAFIQNELCNEENYMVQAEGFEHINGKVCKLQKITVRPETIMSHMEGKVGRNIKRIWVAAII